MYNVLNDVKKISKCFNILKSDILSYLFVWHLKDAPHISKRLSDLKQDGTQKRHHFVAQFLIAFHIVWSILLRVVAQKTPSDWLRFLDNKSEASIQ